MLMKDIISVLTHKYDVLSCTGRFRAGRSNTGRNVYGPHVTKSDNVHDNTSGHDSITRNYMQQPRQCATITSGTLVLTINH